MNNRNYGFDNLKFILMFFVIFGHFLEVYDYLQYKNEIYQIIYSFHMPVFIFINGYFANGNKKNTLKFFYLYVIFQILYSIYNHFFLMNFELETFSISFVIPYWILWYLLVMFFYNLIINLIDVKGIKSLFIFILSIIISLLIGYDTNIGEYLSLSRFFYFLPFFLMGYYFKKNEIPLTSKPIFKYLIVICSLFIIYFIFNYPLISHRVFFGKFSYNEPGCNLGTKFIVMIFAFIWIFFFINILHPILNKKLFIISNVGKNTLWIFLGHGFIIKFFNYFKLNYLVSFNSYIFLIIITFFIMFFLGNNFISQILNKIFFINKKET